MFYFDMNRVVVYTTPSCPWCRRTKQFFKMHDIKFTELDVSTNVEDAREMIKKSGQQGVPVTDIGGEIIVGFDEEKLKRALGLK